MNINTSYAWGITGAWEPTYSPGKLQGNNHHTHHMRVAGQMDDDVSKVSSHHETKQKI